MLFTRVLTFGLLLAATSSAILIKPPALSNQSAGFGLFINGADVTPALLAGISPLPPIFGAGRNSYQQVGTFSSANGLYAISGVSFSNFDDPFINFSGGFTNNSAVVMTFSMPFFSGFVGGPYTIGRDSFSDSVTDGNGNGNVTVTLPAGSAAVSQPFYNATNFDGQGTGCNLNSASGFSGVCNPGGPVLNTPIATPATGTFGTTINVTLSPGDIYTFNGRVEITNSTVPEPSTWMMMFTGIGAITIGAVRRKRA